MHVYESVNLLISLFILLITLFVMGALHRAENKRKTHESQRNTLTPLWPGLPQAAWKAHIAPGNLASFEINFIEMLDKAWEMSPKYSLTRV